MRPRRAEAEPAGIGGHRRSAGGGNNKGLLLPAAVRLVGVVNALTSDMAAVRGAQGRWALLDEAPEGRGLVRPRRAV